MQKKKHPDVDKKSGADKASHEPASQTPVDGKPFPTPGKVTQGAPPAEDDTTERRSYPVPTD
ncbi:MAG: hypothetical protein EON93_22895 [Burkholderiales bacterium]|nr:MAG: hypothetical protein EON93_22895 [Burkholderiales bacterium]